MARPKRLTATRIAAEIEPSHGNLSKIARRLGVSRRAVYDVVMAEEQLQLELFQAREDRVDTAEDMLDERLARGFWPAITEVLHSSHGRKRGWGGVDSTLLEDRVAAIEHLAQLLRLGAYDEGDDDDAGD